VPARRWNRRAVIDPPRDVADHSLSHPQLDALWRRDGKLEFATLGSGNHFSELQADEDGRLWLMVHSGSRAMGRRSAITIWSAANWQAPAFAHSTPTARRAARICTTPHGPVSSQRRIAGK
jgi:hypothetical protein